MPTHLKHLVFLNAGTIRSIITPFFMEKKGSKLAYKFLFKSEKYYNIVDVSGFGFSITLTLRK